jgi:hypothetical protein
MDGWTWEFGKSGVRQQLLTWFNNITSRAQAQTLPDATPSVGKSTHSAKLL